MATEVASVRVLCRRLRSKLMIMNVTPDPEARGSDDGYFWCTHTMNCLGPDGRVAERESCRAGRDCFESR
jgi:hypothetical protein